MQENFPLSASGLWTLLFCALLVGGLLLRLWLATRQVRHVAGHRNQVPVAFADSVDLPSHQKAADYTVAKMRLNMLSGAWSAALLLGWTLLGGLHALNQALLDLMGNGLAQQLALLACFGLIGTLLDLPLDAWRTFRLEQSFGFNKATPGLWWGDQAKGLALAVVIGLPLAALVLWIMHEAPQTWWLWGWGVWLTVNMLTMVVYPTLIAPLFNTFTPLQDESLKARVQALMARCGFAAKGLFVMDGSRRSAHANAYFTGFGAAKRVVFFDTLLARLTADEVDAVLAHELGHFRHRHVTKRMLGMAALSLVAFAALGWLAGRSWFYTGLGVDPSLDGGNEAVALLLFALVAPLVGSWLMPALAQWSRRHEFEADAYAMHQTNGRDLASALIKLHRDNASTLTPDPMFVRFYYSHPPAGERLSRLGA